MSSYGTAAAGGHTIILSSLDAMYARAQDNGDTALMKLLEHRAETHDGGPCDCQHGRE